MGLLDMFKKKSQEMTGSAGSLDDLPPIPQNPFSSDQGDSFSQMDGLPPLPGQSASQTSEPAGSLLMDDPLDSSSSLPEPGLEVPQPDESPDSNEASQEGLNAALPDEGKIDDQQSAPLNTDDLEIPFLPEAQEEPLDNPQPSFDADVLNESLQEPEPVKEESDSSADEQNQSPDQMDFSAEVPLDEEVGDASFSQGGKDSYEDEESEDDDQKESLPDFSDLQEDLSGVDKGEQLAYSSGPSVDVTTESLLLKSIFVEKEHYANILFSLKRVKEDLQNSGSEQRKLSHIDMKLAKEYGKLSGLLENVNENLMVIEHIVSNEQF